MAAKKTPAFAALDRNKTLAENTVNAGPVVLDSMGAICGAIRGFVMGGDHA